MPKPVIACMFKVLHHRLLRYIFYTRQKIVSRCYVIFCNGAYCTRVQTCAIVRFQNTWELWSCCVCRQHGQLASHIANLFKYRWVRIILAWNLSVRHRSLGGRPHTWDYQIQVFCRYKGLGPWLEEAKCHHHWTALFEVSHTFCQMCNKTHTKPMYIIQFSFHRLCPKRARLVARRH